MFRKQKYWLGRLSIALVAAVVVWLIGRVTPSWESDVGQGLLAGCLAYFVMAYEAKRIRDLRRRLKAERQFNHHVRNALDVIIMAEHHPTDNHSKIVIETAERLIQELRQVSAALNDINPNR